MCDRIISVKPRWAEAFFQPIAPKTVELRKHSFGSSVKPGDSIVIYSTMPTGAALGIIEVAKREILPIDELWWQTQEGSLAKVSQAEFRKYYLDHSFGVGVWVEKVELWKRAIGLTELRERLGDRWQPPQQIQKLPEGFLSR
jgi:predicted transcriptional regulator